MMNKLEYYPYHADLLIKSSIKKGKRIYYNQKENILSFYYDQADSVVAVQDPKILVDYLLNKASFQHNCLSLIAENYVQDVLLHGTSEQIDFFLTHSTILTSVIDYDVIEPILNQLPEDIIKKIFLISSSSFSVISYRHNFDDVFNFLKKQNDSILLLSEFLSKRNKTIKKNLKIYIRDTLISHFPHQLEQLRKISVIDEYLQAQKTNKSIIDDTDVIKTQYLKINCILAKNQYPIPGHDTVHYVKYLLSLLKAFVALKDETGVVSFQMDDSCTKHYICSDAYINMNQHCSLKLDDFKTILHDYFSYIQGLQLAPYQSSSSSKIAFDWLHLALLNYKLNDDLVETPKKNNIKKL